jgi:Leucine-rich repeat (LRR) protein
VGGDGVDVFKAETVEIQDRESGEPQPELPLQEDLVINSSLPAPDPIVRISDPGLLAAIASALNTTTSALTLNPPHASDLRVITRLDASAQSIVNLLSGLEYAVNLRELSLADNQITSLRWQDAFPTDYRVSRLAPRSKCWTRQQ